MRSCQMKVVWHRCFRVIITRQIPMRTRGLFRQNNRGRFPLVSQTPADAAAIVWISLNVHKCIRNGVSVSLFLLVCLWIVCRKLWFMIVCLVYSLVSCGAVRPSVVANPGEGKSTESFNKWTSACGPGVHRSSHLHTGTHIPTHSCKHYSLFFFGGGGINYCLKASER